MNKDAHQLVLAETLRHLGNVLSMLADIPVNERPDVLANAIAFHNQQCPDSRIQPTGPGYITHLRNVTPFSIITNESSNVIPLNAGNKKFPVTQTTNDTGSVLIDKLNAMSTSSCTCGVKTSVFTYHKDYCNYKTLQSAVAELHRISYPAKEGLDMAGAGFIRSLQDYTSELVNADANEIRSRLIQWAPQIVLDAYATVISHGDDTDICPNTAN